MTHGDITDWASIGAMLAYLVRCPHCDRTFMIHAEDKPRLVLCCFCGKMLPNDNEGEMRVQ